MSLLHDDFCLENNVFDEWDAIYLLLMNNVIVFIRLVLSEDLGSVNPRHERYMYMQNATDVPLFSPIS